MKRWQIWWTDPAKLMLFVTMPVVLLSAAIGGPVMHTYGALNFITPWILLLCALSIGSLAAGSWIGDTVALGSKERGQFDPARVEIAIIALAAASILAHLIYLGAALAKPTVLLAAMTGQRGAIYAVKAGITKIPGVTSLTQMYMLAVPLYAAFEGLFGRKPGKSVRTVVNTLFAMIILRAFVGLERFALIEVAICYAIPKLSFTKKRLDGRLAFLPLFGFFALVILFAIGEFMRAWAYYKNAYSNFGEFVWARLLGYLATATNNGAGVFQTSGPMGGPFFTAAWVRKLPIWGPNGPPFGDPETMRNFFERYATSEFNNPGGVMTGYLDYGVVGGILLFIFTGFLGGLIYGSFQRRRPLGVLLFPTMYTGFLVITQAYYWGDPRAFTVWMVSPFVLWYITRRSISSWRQARQQRQTETFQPG